MSEARKIDFDAIAWNSPAPGIRSRAFTHFGKQVRLLEITRDFVEEDWCLKGHAGYVIEGELEIDFDGETIIYRAGDGLLIQPGESSRHKPKAVSQVVKLFFVEDC
ncbi:MAG: cupin domain-containing protein [Acidobacteriota bacterium]